jgi:uncharacterized protein YlxP (DUF503 family)
MIVGVAVVELRVHESQSLKEKRGVVRRIVGRLRHRFNVSVAEVGGQETWQRAVVGISMVGNDEGVVRRGLQKALELVDEMHLAEVLGSEIELMRMPLEALAFGAGEDAGSGDEDLDLPWSGSSAGAFEEGADGDEGKG